MWKNAPMPIDGTCASCGEPISRTETGGWCHWDTTSYPAHSAEPRKRENPASAFIARHLAERVTGLTWSQMPADKQAEWREHASDLVISMYERGFMIPRPADQDAVWAELRG